MKGFNINVKEMEKKFKLAKKIKDIIEKSNFPELLYIKALVEDRLEIYKGATK